MDHLKNNNCRLCLKSTDLYCTDFTIFGNELVYTVNNKSGTRCLYLCAKFYQLTIFLGFCWFSPNFPLFHIINNLKSRLLFFTSSLFFLPIVKTKLSSFNFQFGVRQFSPFCDSFQNITNIEDLVARLMTSKLYTFSKLYPKYQIPSIFFLLKSCYALISHLSKSFQFQFNYDGCIDKCLITSSVHVWDHDEVILVWCLCSCRGTILLELKDG